METIAVLTFLCGRPQHTVNFFESLIKVTGIQDLNLVVIVDSCKGSLNLQKLDEYSDLFNSVTIVEQSLNFGLRSNILFGVDLALAKFDIVIVLENDLEVSKDLLSYTNEYLTLRRKSDQLRAGCLYSFNVDNINNSTLSNFGLSRYFLSWGWIVRREDWNEFRLEIDQVSFIYRLFELRTYNANFTYNFWIQLMINKLNVKRTWAIYFYDFIFRNGYLVMVPEYSLVKNIGWDHSGDNCGENSIFGKEKISHFSGGRQIDYIDRNFQVFHKRYIAYNFVKDVLYIILKKFVKVFKG